MQAALDQIVSQATEQRIEMPVGRAEMHVVLRGTKDQLKPIVTLANSLGLRVKWMNKESTLVCVSAPKTIPRSPHGKESSEENDGDQSDQ